MSSQSIVHIQKFSYHDVIKEGSTTRELGTAVKERGTSTCETDHLVDGNS
jgi:hypothetical protein